MAIEIEEAKKEAKKLIDQAKAWILIVNKGEASGLCVYGGRRMLFSVGDALCACEPLKALIQAALILEQASHRMQGR